MNALERVDPQDPPQFDAWYDVYVAGTVHGREHATPWTREEARAHANLPSEYWEDRQYVSRDVAGEVTGALQASMPLRDNTSVIAFGLAVRPDLRRRGIGTFLFRQLEQLAADTGRTTLLTEVAAPLTGESAGQPFARAHGFSVANTEVHRVLELPLDEGLLDDLAAEAAAKHGGYELVSWVDRCPDELVDGMAALHAAFIQEIPLGEVDWEPEVWDAARVREREERSSAQGRRTWTTAAVAPDGTLVGHTELHLPTHDPGKVFQWDTLVMPAHRGHRLGLALKARNHRLFQAANPEPMTAHTGNAEQNTHMNAVNNKLGFRSVERNEEWQRILCPRGAAPPGKVENVARQRAERL
jgi:GNAT superfamily N-acetyltransferase